MTIIDDFFSSVTNRINVGKFDIETDKYNKLLLNILEKLKEYKYVEYYEVKDNKLYVKFSEYLNKVGAIKPRFPVSYKNLEKYEKRYLPASNFGLLIISSSKGIKTNEECKKEKIGGVLICYVY